MKLKPSSILLLVFALSLAGGSALVARALMRPQEPVKVVVEESVSKPAPAYLLVALKNIEPGDFVDSTSIGWRELREGENRAGRIVVREDARRREQEMTIFGATVRSVVAEGNPITTPLLLRPGDPGFIAAVLAPGMRAVSIPTSAVTSNAGLVSAGDWVDVILSVERDEAAMLSTQVEGSSMYNYLAAQTILRQVRVLALNSSTESIVPAYVEPQAKSEQAGNKGNTSRRMVFETITLEVSPEDAELLAVGREAGSLQVALRSMKEPSAMPQEGKVVTRLQDITGIFGVKASRTEKVVQTFHGMKAGAVRF